MLAPALAGRYELRLTAADGAGVGRAGDEG
jgi:hypothetical protein